MKNHFRHIRLLVLTGAALLTSFGSGASLLRAQAMPQATGPGSFVSVGYEFSAYRNPYGQRNLGGYGVYVDLHPTWRYGIEAEGRTLSLNSDEGVTLKNYLIGPKVTVLPGRIQPYGKFLVGAGHITFPFGYATGTYFSYVPGGGVDIRVNDFVSVRAADFEYQMWDKFDYGPMRPYGVSVGVEVRLNPMRRMPKHAYYSTR